MKLVKDNTKLGTLIKSIQTRGAKLDNDIHLAAVSCVALVTRDRNTTRITSLVNAMPKSSRRKALCDWFEATMPVTMDYSNGKATIAKADSDDWQEYLSEYRARLTKAIKTPFWDLKPEKGAKDTLSLDSIIKYLARKANSQSAPAELQDQLTQVVKFAESLKSGSQLELPLPGSVKPENRASLH
jgi:hypothetical protein